MKTFKCYTCKEILPEDNFAKRTPKGNQTRTVQNACRPCFSAYRKELRARNPEKAKQQRDQWFKIRRAKMYGLTVDQVDAMVAAQNNQCRICAKGLLPKFAIDHCHQTGRVRGLLCMNCNTGIGMLGDTIEALESALRYLREGLDNPHLAVVP